MSGTSISQEASFVSSHEQNHGPEPGSLRAAHGPNEAIASRAKSAFGAAGHPRQPPGMCPATATGRTATVKGTWFGHPVDATFTQTGCGLPRWAKIGQIFN